MHYQFHVFYFSSSLCVQLHSLSCLPFCCVPVTPFPGSGDPSLGHSCPGHILYGLLQCAVPGATLEEYSEASASAECGHVTNFGLPKNDACNIFAAGATLDAGLLPDLIQLLI